MLRFATKGGTKELFRAYSIYIRTLTCGTQVLHKPIPIELKSEDIEETFVKGSGPGGQKVNKTSSCVVLRHIPSGVVVKCQKHRSQERNRREARKILIDKLDLLVNKEESRIAQEIEHRKKLESSYARKRRLKEELLQEATKEKEKMLALLAKARNVDDTNK